MPLCFAFDTKNVVCISFGKGQSDQVINSCDKLS